MKFLSDLQYKFESEIEVKLGKPMDKIFQLEREVEGYDPKAIGRGAKNDGYSLMYEIQNLEAIENELEEMLEVMEC